MKNEKEHKKSTSDQEMLDVDVRFLLANERTLLAWIRTALALMAGGLAMTQFGEKSTQKSWLGILIITIGGAMALLGYARFRAADKAIRSGTLPSMGYSPKLQVGTVVFFAVVLVAVEMALI